MDVVSARPSGADRARSRSRAPTTNRLNDGVQDEATRTKAERIARLYQKKMNRMARQGEGDRHTTASITKHLVSYRHSVPSNQAVSNNFARWLESVAWARRTDDEECLWLVFILSLHMGVRRWAHGYEMSNEAYRASPSTGVEVLNRYIEVKKVLLLKSTKHAILLSCHRGHRQLCVLFAS